MHLRVFSKRSKTVNADAADGAEHRGAAIWAGVVRLDVDLELARLREGASARGADVGPLPGMDAHVLRQVARVRERLWAEPAAERSIVAVHARVIRQLARVSEPSATVLARERLRLRLSSAGRRRWRRFLRAGIPGGRFRLLICRRRLATVRRPDVVVQVARLTEPALAELALKRSFVGVDAEMLGEVARLDERLSADRAAERPMFEVEPHMLAQLAGVQKLLVAAWTRVRRTTRVILRLHV